MTTSTSLLRPLLRLLVLAGVQDNQRTHLLRLRDEPAAATGSTIPQTMTSTSVSIDSETTPKFRTMSPMKTCHPKLRRLLLRRQHEEIAVEELPTSQTSIVFLLILLSPCILRRRPHNRQFPIRMKDMSLRMKT